MMKAMIQAIFSNNVILVSGLGLFLLLAGSQTLTLAVGMSIAFIANLILAPMIVFFAKSMIQQEIKLMAYLMIFATVSTFVTMVMMAIFPVWVEGLSLYLPLMALSGVFQYRTEMIQPSTKLSSYMLENVGVGLGFAIIILPLGLLTELLGSGVIALQTITDTSVYIFYVQVFEDAYINGIFSGSLRYIGSLLLFALLIALFKGIKYLKGNRP